MTTFYCGTCGRDTEYAEEWDGVRCRRCGDDFQCQDCGFEISPDGVCLRLELADDGTCPSTRDRFMA